MPQSPERLQARLEELAGGVERERGLVSEAERRSRDLQARMDTIAKVSPALLLPPLQKRKEKRQVHPFQRSVTTAPKRNQKQHDVPLQGHGKRLS